MGRLSERLLEIREEQQFSAPFRTECPNCKRDIGGELIVTEPEDVEGTENPSISCQSEVHCEYCGKRFACNVEVAGGKCLVALQDVPDHAISVGQPRLWPPAADWLNGPPSKSPYNDFSLSLSELKRIATRAHELAGDSLTNRMCFSQIMSAFEAYLSDTLLNGVDQDFDKMIAVAEKDTELNKIRFTLTDVSKGKSLVAEKVTDHLRGLIYHNIPRISPLYEAAFGTPIIQERTDLETFMKYVSDRHDCVHRNGRDKNDASPVKFTVQFVLDAISFFEAVTERLEESIRANNDCGEEIPF